MFADSFLLTALCDDPTPRAGFHSEKEPFLILPYHESNF